MHVFFVSLIDVLFHFPSGVFLGLIIKHLLLIHSLPVNLFQPNFPCFNSFLGFACVFAIFVFFLLSPYIFQLPTTVFICPDESVSSSVSWYIQ